MTPAVPPRGRTALAGKLAAPVRDFLSTETGGAIVRVRHHRRARLDIGQVRERRRLTLPALAAVGGAVVPVLVYLAVTAGGPGTGGWGTVVSTDTALALGVLAPVAPGGTRLRVTLLAFAVVDDLRRAARDRRRLHRAARDGSLAIAVGLFGVVLALRYAPFRWRGPVAAVVGVGVWLALLESGIDPVITGLAVGLATTAFPPPRRSSSR